MSVLLDQWKYDVAAHYWWRKMPSLRQDRIEGSLIKICVNTESCYYSQSLDMKKRVWNTYGELQKWLKMMLLGSHICLYDRRF